MKKLWISLTIASLTLMLFNLSDFCYGKDMATKEAEYLKRIEKDKIKDEYGRKIMDRKPSGFMTKEEYERALI